MYIKNNLTDSDDKMYFTVNSFIDINNIINGWSNIFLRKANAKPCGYHIMYMDKDFIEDKLY